MIEEEIKGSESTANLQPGDAPLKEESKEDTATRERSKIAFPYNSLQDTVEIAERLHEHAETGDCSDAQLAAWLDMSPKSSTYRVRISSTRIFGLIEQGGSEDHTLTDLGKRIIDPNRSRSGRVDAFLNVPLYEAIFNHYDGGLIPPSAAFERQITDLGVASKQKGRARSALEKSADYAGFFEHGRNRLVKPGVHPDGDKLGKEKTPPKGGGDGGNGGDFEGHDPMIVGLFKRVCARDQTWELEDRVEWLQTAAQLFKFIYGSHDEDRVKITIEERKD